MPAAEITVVVCTRNRAGVIGPCLEALAGQDMPPERFEVVVVDNGSTDGTAAVLRRWRDGDPSHRRVEEEHRTGLSRARNAGLAAAGAPIVAFIDDDARAAAGWVRRSRRASAAASPSAPWADRSS